MRKPSKFRCHPGVSGDKYSPLVEEYSRKEAKALLDRKKYSYWLIMNVHGVCGVIVYTDFHATTCNIHIHAPKFLTTKGALRLVFSPPFHDYELQKVYGTIRSDNVKARRNAEKIGFVLEHTLYDYYNIGVDMCIYALTKEAAQKWIGNPQAQDKEAA